MTSFSTVINLADTVLFDHISELLNKIKLPFLKGIEIGWNKTLQQNSQIFNSILGTKFKDLAGSDVTKTPEIFGEALGLFLGALFNAPRHAITVAGNHIPYFKFTENLKKHNKQFCRLVRAVAVYNRDNRLDAITRRMSKAQIEAYEKFLEDLIQIAS